MIPLIRAAGSAATKLFIKRPAGKRDLADLATRLEESGATLERRYAALADSAANRDKLRHIVGIERWGQRRLETILGKDPASDEYDDYQPSASASWRDLRLAFANTRRNTVALARQLDQAGTGDDRKARHNERGDLTAREWLYYLRLHADLESRRIK